MELNRRRGGDRARGRAAVLGLVMVAAVSLGACRGGSQSAAGPGAADGNANTSQALSVRDLVPILTRYGVGPGGIGLDLTYAAPVFFAVTGLQPPAELASRPTLAFLLQEAVHEGELGDEPPLTFLQLEDGSRVSPYSVVVTATDPHHRTTRLLFPEPEGVASSTARSIIRLVVPMEDGSVSVGNTFEWQRPLDLRVQAGQTGKEAAK